MRYLLNELSSDTTGDELNMYAGGKRFRAYATDFGSSKITLQEKTSKNTWITLKQFTESGSHEMLLSQNNVTVRAVLSNCTDSTDSVTMEVLE